MVNLRIIAPAFISSLTLHAVGGACLYAVGFTAISPAVPDRAVYISYVHTTAQTTDRTPPTRGPAAPAKVSAPVKPAAAEALSKKVITKSQSYAVQRRQAIARQAQRPMVRHAGGEALPKTGTDFLSDPQKGKIYVGYFASVKEKIHKTLRRKYARGESAQGNVSLLFVLNSRGALVKADVNNKESSASDILKDFAMDCLKNAAPFGAFPSRLDASQISFTVNVFFDEM